MGGMHPAGLGAQWAWRPPAPPFEEALRDLVGKGFFLPQIKPWDFIGPQELRGSAAALWVVLAGRDQAAWGGRGFCGQDQIRCPQSGSPLPVPQTPPGGGGQP